MNNEQIISYIFKMPILQKKLLKELYIYYNNNNNIYKTIINETYKQYVLLKEPILKEDILYILKDKKDIKKIKEILNTKIDISVQLFLKEMTIILKTYKLNKLKEKYKNIDINNINEYNNELETINKFTLLNDTEVINFKDIKEIIELNKKEIGKGFLTGYEEIDKYVIDSNGFLKNKVVVLAAPPHTGKCVIGETIITLREKNEVFKMNYKDFYNSKYIYDYTKVEDIKFIEIAKVKDNIEIWTNTGFKKINKIGKTKKYQTYHLKLDNNYELKCADEHIVATLTGLKFVKDLKIGIDTVLTDKLFSLVTSLNIEKKSNNMYDIELKEEPIEFNKKEEFENVKVGSFYKTKENKFEFYEVLEVKENKFVLNMNSRLYFTNGILSHNTLFFTTLSSMAIKKNFNVLYLSFEMSEIDILKRIYVNIFNKKMKYINKELNEIEEKMKYIDKDMLGNLLVKEYPSSSCTSIMIEELLLMLQEEEKIKKEKIFPDILMIDQITTMGSNLPINAGLYLRGKDNIQELKAIAKKFDLLIFGGVQAQRETKKSEGVQMENISESWGIPQIADLGFGAVTDPESVKKDYYELKINCFKNRLTGNLEESIWAVNKQKMTFVKREIS